jgi:hypothetical protein
LNKQQQLDANKGSKATTSAEVQKMEAFKKDMRGAHFSVGNQ